MVADSGESGEAVSGVTTSEVILPQKEKKEESSESLVLGAIFET